MTKTSKQAASKPRSAVPADGFRRRSWSCGWRPACLGLLCLAITAGVAAYVVWPAWLSSQRANKAQAAIREHDYEVALPFLEANARQSPSSSAAAFELGRTLRRAGQLDRAQTEIARSESLGHPVALTDLEKQLLQAQAGRAPTTFPKLVGLAQSWPDQREVILESLILGSLPGNFLADAYRYATLWLSHSPNDWYAQVWLGKILEAGGKHEPAVEAYAKALALKPGQPDALLRQAGILVRRGRYQEARPLFDDYLAQHGESPAALLGLSHCLRAMESPTAALTSLERALGHASPSPEAFLLRGQIALDLDEPAQAVMWLEKASRELPQELEPLQSLATAYRQLGRNAEAAKVEARKKEVEIDLRRLEVVKKELLRHRDNVDLRYEAGALCLRLGRTEDAAGWLLGALSLSPAHEPSRKLLRQVLPSFSPAPISMPGDTGITEKR